MNTEEHIKEYMMGVPEAKSREIQTLHERILQISPGCRLWFTDGKNAEGKVVSNPNIGYGAYTINYADRTSREFYRIGLSANTTGISVYILGLENKTFLAETYGPKLGKAKVTGYCIKFKSLKDIDVEVLESAIKYGLELPG
jgi:hypothetical protein